MFPVGACARFMQPDSCVGLCMWSSMQVRPGGIFGIKTDPHIFIRWRELATRAFSASASSDPYDMLGVSRGANPDEIKKAYRREALKVCGVVCG